MFKSISGYRNKVGTIWRHEARHNATQESADTKRTAALILCLVSVILTVMNIQKGYWFMAYSTGALVAGFAISAILCRRAQGVKAADAIMMILVITSFTLYAVTGKNEGFAILWILLIPALAPNVLNLKYGVFTSFYYQVLLMVMFYTPLRENFTEYYTETFMIRFPVLYFAALVSSMYIVFALKYYQFKTDRLARRDGLTQLANRLEYNAFLEEIADDPELLKKCSFVCFDLNELKDTNDSIGHAAGDEMILGAAKLIEGALYDAILVARTGGDEFAVVTAVDESVLKNQLNSLNNDMAAWKGSLAKSVSASYGYACAKDYPDMTVEGLMDIADKKMYEAKAAYYKREGKERRRSGLDS